MSGKKTVLFKSELVQDVASVARFMRELADKIETQEVILKQGGSELTVNLPAHLELEVEVTKKHKKGRTKHQLELELEWIEGEDLGAGLKLG